MNSTQAATDTLNSLLRGELAAIETYDQALIKYRNEPQGAELSRLKAEHQQAGDLLRKDIVRRGGEPSSSSGPWGTWAQMIEGAAKLLGQTAALKALKEGEEHGVREYEEALEDENLDSESRVLINATLLPKARRHVQAVDRLMKG